MDNNQTIAFALGGLAGNNAFGAGFLQAAIDCNVKPDLISCSSGQIFWAWKYLKALEGGDNLEKVFQEEIEQAYPYPSRDLNWFNMLTFGMENVYRPVSPVDYLTDMYGNMLNSLKTLSTSLISQKKLKNFFWFKELSSWTPSRSLMPARPDELFEDMSVTFNQSEIAIAFNSYDPPKGEEYVHLNDKAREALGIEYGQEKSYRQGTFYQTITLDEIKDALWLYQYGFPEGRTRLDGAYYRQILLSELVRADKIFVARPINKKWLGKLPSNYIGSKDLETEISFNGTYIGEKDKIELINELVRKGKLPGDQYHHIHLFELEIQTQEGFFDYVFEDPTIFNEAREQATNLFKNPATWS